MRKTPHTALPIADWPASDRRRWSKLIGGRGSRSTISAPPDWSSDRVKTIQAAYSRWLNWILQNRSEAMTLRPGLRCEARTIETYIKDQSQRLSNASLVAAILDIHLATRYLDKRYDPTAIQHMLSILRRKRSDRRQKLERIVPSQDLFALGLELMQSVSRRAPVNKEVAEQYRDGLAIALLAVRPLRVANFIGIQIGKHLVTRHGETWICLSARETKNRMALEFRFPPALSKNIMRYLDRIRPWFLQQGARLNEPDYLWLSRSGRPIHKNTFSRMIKTRTKEKFGKAVNPHLFRDCLATTIAKHHPNLAWTTPLMLGHRSPDTCGKNYIHMDTKASESAFLEHLKELRR